MSITFCLAQFPRMTSDQYNFTSDEDNSASIERFTLEMYDRSKRDIELYLPVTPGRG